MKNLFQGSNCNINQQIQSNASNHFKRITQTMLLGQQNHQISFSNSNTGIQQQILNRQLIFKQMNQAWDLQNSNIKNQQLIMKQMLLKQQIQFAKIQQKLQQSEWQKSQQYIHQQQLLLNQNFKQATNRYNQNIKRQENLEIRHQALFQKVYTQEQKIFMQQEARLKRARGNMFVGMVDDPDPRFKNSDFIKISNHINKGEIYIKNNELVMDEIGEQQKLMNNQLNQINIEEAKLQQKFKQQKQKYQKQEKILKNQFQKSAQYISQAEIEKLTPQQRYNYQWSKRLIQYQQKRKNTSQYQKQLQNKYIQVLKQPQLDHTQAWQSATDLQQHLLFGDYNQNYIFTPNNPFLDVALPLNLGLQYINQGRNHQAILSLEAHLTKYPKDSQSWRILGHLLQQNDQDLKSVACFATSLKYDENNLNTLLQIGISCANILQEVRAMNYLRKWLQKHPIYKKFSNNIVVNDKIAEIDNFKPEQIIDMNSNIIQVFENVLKINPQDPQLFTALALLYFMKRQYQKAAAFFHQAATRDIHNYSLWNKLGATLAHLGKANQAIDCYHNALDIKPNYVKVWVNLGIIHGFKGQYQQAARFYLCALSLKPDAKHIWSYVHSCFLHMKREDLIRLISQQNPHLFTEFDVLKFEDLPIPQMDYMQSTKQYIIGKQSQKWARQFLK